MEMRWNNNNDKTSYIITGTQEQFEELLQNGIKLDAISEYPVVGRITAKRLIKNIEHAWFA